MFLEIIVLIGIFLFQHDLLIDLYVKIGLILLATKRLKLLVIL